jgi:hypothetical protein
MMDEYRKEKKKEELLKQKIEIAKEGFYAILSNDEDAINEVIVKNNIPNISSLQLRINKDFRYRIFDPKPTEEEIKQYEEALHDRFTKKPINVSFSLIDDLLAADKNGTIEDFAKTCDIKKLSSLMDKFVTYDVDSASILKRVKVAYAKVKFLRDRYDLMKKTEQQPKKETKPNEYIIKERENKINITKDIINDYLATDDIVIAKFLVDPSKGRTFTIVLFEKYLDILKNNPETRELYDKFMSAYEERQKYILFSIKDAVNAMNEMFDKVADYSMLDFYENCLYKSRMNFREFMSYCRTMNKNNLISKEDLRTLERFNSLYSSGNKELNGEAIERYSYSENGRDLTKEEKQRVIDYLKERHVPITQNTYNGAYKRFINGQINPQKTY